MFARIVAVVLASFAPHAGCDRYVAHAAFDGRTWSVVPTRCGRRRAWLEPRRAFAELPEPAHTRTVFDQFRCHAIFAAYKADWDLETDRPVVSFRALVASACNP